MLTLAESDRWIEKLVPVQDGSTFIIVAGYYGYSGASNEGGLYMDNERILATALARLAQFIDTPYFLVGDFNIVHEDSQVISASTKSGAVFDLAREWAADHRYVQPTFLKTGEWCTPRHEGERDFEN